MEKIIYKTSDNVELNNMLSRGLADNHFHLKGSAPYFYMSWINMMNQVNKKEFVKDIFFEVFMCFIMIMPIILK